MTDGTDSFGGDVLVKGTAKSGEVQVPVHGAELLACFGYPGGAPAQRHLAVLAVFTLREWVRAM
jgi:hypothetical protein